MDGTVWIGLIIGIVCLAVLLGRVPAVIVFLCLLIGNLLVSYTTADIYLFFSSIFKDQTSVTTRLVLFVMPLALTSLFLWGATAKSKVFLEVIPALLSGVVAVILLYPIVPAFQASLNDNFVWKVIDQYQGPIIFGASLAVLLDVWFVYPKARNLKRKR